MRIENLKHKKTRVQNTGRIISFLVLSAIVFIGLYLRVESVVNTQVVDLLKHDDRQYFLYAYNLRSHGIYSQEPGIYFESGRKPKPDALRSPGYPLFLALFVGTEPSGKSVSRILFCQAIISSLTLILGFYLMKRYLPMWLAALATLLSALSPHLIAFNSYILSETLFCFFLVSTGWLMSFLCRHANARLAIVVGIMLGLSNLVRPSLMYFPLFAAGLMLLSFENKKGIRYAAALWIGFLAAYSPWLVRNKISMGHVADQRLMINFLHHGIYPGFKYNERSETYGYPYRFDPESDKISANKEAVLREIVRRFSAEPWKHLKWYMFGKPVSFWSWSIIQGQGDVFVYEVSQSPYFSDHLFKWSYDLMRDLHWPIVILGLFGALIAWFPWHLTGSGQGCLMAARWCSLLLSYYVLMHLVGAPFPRYSVPLRPYLYGMAMLPVAWMSAGLRVLFRRIF